MTPAAVLRRYWNGRLDPLDWKRARADSTRERWRLARDTFLTPATADAIDALGDLAGKRVLELGCGHGHGSSHLARRGAQVLGIDVSDRRCSIASEALGGEAVFCAADAEHLPVRDGSVDAVFARDILMYTSPRRVLEACNRVLVPGGRAAFVESLAGVGPYRWYRAWTTPRAHRELARYLDCDAMERLGGPLRRVWARPYYLTSVAAFLILFSTGSASLHRLAMRCLFPLDRTLLAAAPGLRHAAWRAAAVLEKPADGD